MDQLPLGSEADLVERKRKLVWETLNALASEAYEAAVKRGDSITDPAAWRDSMRSHYAAEAKRQGAGYLKAHHDRLIGSPTRNRAVFCGFCEAKLGIVYLEIGDTKYCDLDCAEGIDKRITYSDWKKKVKEQGGYKSPDGSWVPIEQIALFKNETKKPPDPA